jgi:hypothetical protein
MKNLPMPYTVHSIDQKIYMIRGVRVMLSVDLARLYSVETRALNQAVRRNITRFPADFMFQLSPAEAASLVSQHVIPDARSFGGRMPYAFTEHGVAMLSSVLRSPGAIEINIEIVRAFVRLRNMIESNKEMVKRIDELEKKYDERFAVVFRAITAHGAASDAAGAAGTTSEDDRVLKRRPGRELTSVARGLP